MCLSENRASGALSSRKVRKSKVDRHVLRRWLSDPQATICSLERTFPRVKTSFRVALGHLSIFKSLSSRREPDLCSDPAQRHQPQQMRKETHRAPVADLLLDRAILDCVADVRRGNGFAGCNRSF